MDVSTLLADLDFSEREVDVYFGLAELGKAQANLIAKRAKLPRTTAYPILNKLIEKGVVSSEVQKGVTYFTANPPSSLLNLVHRQKEAVMKLEVQTKELVERIEPYFKRRNYSVPKLEFVEGKEQVETLLYRQLEPWFKSMASHDNTLWGYQDNSFIKSYRPWLEHYWDTKDDEHRVSLFCAESEDEVELHGKIANREIRLLHEEFGLSSGTLIAGDYIVMLMTKQKPHYAVQIHDPVFANNLRIMMRHLWSLTD